MVLYDGIIVEPFVLVCKQVGGNFFEGLQFDVSLSVPLPASDLSTQTILQVQINSRFRLHVKDVERCHCGC